MSEIEVYVCDRTGDWISPLPEASVQDVTWALNDSGSASFDVDPLSEGASSISLAENEIQIWMDGELSWWGVPWAMRGGPDKITVSCEGLLSYFTKRYIDRMTLLYTSIDQLQIGWDLVRYAQDETLQANRDLFIDAAVFSNSGIPRSPTYKREEHQNILDVLKEFATYHNGFDFEIVGLPDGRRLWTPYYPRKGQLQEDFSIQWGVDHGRNIATFTFSESAMQIATEAYITGGSVNGEKVEERYEDPAASAQRGVMQAIASEGSSLDRPTLLARATKEVDSRKNPQIVTDITSARTLDADMLGVVTTGDWLPTTIDHGRIQVDANHRIVAITWRPDDTLGLKFGEAVAA